MLIPNGFFVPVDKDKQNLRKLITSCHDSGSRVVLCTIPPINEENFFARHERKLFDAMREYSAVIESCLYAAQNVAKEHDVPLVNLNQLLAKQPERLSDDGVHSSETGTNLIAEHVAKAIQNAIGSTRQSFTDVCSYGGIASGVVSPMKMAHIGMKSSSRLLKTNNFSFRANVSRRFCEKIADYQRVWKTHIEMPEPMDAQRLAW